MAKIKENWNLEDRLLYHGAAIRLHYNNQWLYGYVEEFLGSFYFVCRGYYGNGIKIEQGMSAHFLPDSKVKKQFSLTPQLFPKKDK
ncbi:MAG: hypothetical protein D3913_16565 [Candidatus Electrothrix sp. LOE1_4_5]|nr:hypothetical protein [Candidatus Electrothrix gigas]